MITGQRVLCAAQPATGHAMTTAAIGLELQRAGNEVVMLTYMGRPADIYTRVGLSCVDLRPSSQEEGMASVLSLLLDFDPDITVCDWSHDLWLAQMVAPPRCRVSVLRAEQLLGHQRASPFLPDKFGLARPLPPQAPENRFLDQHGRPLISDRRVLYRTEAIVIPSLPDFDPLPPDVAQRYPDTEFVFTGPLVVDCFDPVQAGLEDWCAEERRQGRPIALMTTGTAWGAELCVAFAKAMGRARFSCIMAVPDGGGREAIESVAAPHLAVAVNTRLSDLIKLSNVVIHHCGHGTFQAVILGGKPAITLPSFEHDREDSALSLEDLGCAIHLSDSVYRRGLQIEAINDAVDRVLGDARIAEATARMSQRLVAFMAEGGLRHLLKVLVERGMCERFRQYRRRRPTRRYSQRNAMVRGITPYTKSSLWRRLF